MKRILIAAAAMAMAVEAQPPVPAPATDKEVPISKAERKNRAPVSKEVLRVKLPRPVEAKLDNGVSVLIIEDHRLPTVSVSLLIRGAGGLGEPANLPGLASVTAQMMREGTAARSSKQIAEDAARLGANVFVAAGFGSTEATVSASGLSDNFDQWFALMTDVLLHPSFPAEELSRLKQRQIVALKQQRTQPQFLASERFNQAVFGTFPAAIVSATPASLQAMTPELLVNWYQERYRPQNAILGIAGDVKPGELIPQLKKAFAEWKRTDFVQKLPPNPVPVIGKKIFLINRPDSVQTTMMLGNIAVDRRSPDFFPMTVLNRVLGGGAAARLFLKLREEKGYTYGAYSSLAPGEFPGPWRATADVRTPVTEGAMSEFLGEFRRIREEKVPASEMDDAKRSLVASFAISLEQPAQILGYAMTRKLYALPEDYWDTYAGRVDAVSPEDIERVARKYISLDNLQVVAVGDAAKIRAALERFGPVTVYDMDGKVVTQ